MKQNCLFYGLCGVLGCTASAAFSQKDFYTPEALVMPFHDTSHQLSLSAGIGGGYNATASYSFSHHLALFATGTLDHRTARRTSFFGDPYDVVKHDQAFTYGAGYFTPRKGKFNVFETYIGYGTYKINNYWYFTKAHDLGDTYTQAQYSSLFCQAVIGRKTKKYEYGFAARLSYSRYGDVLFYDNNPNTDYERSRYKKFGTLNLDPAACFGYRIHHLSINVQAGLSAPVSSSRRTVVNTFTTYFNGATDVTVQEGTETDAIIAAFGRLSLQYDFAAGKRNR